MTPRRMTRARNVSDTHPSDGHFEDDESQEELTRCVCGMDELQVIKNAPEFKEVDTGFFIQCEECSAWQHGYCVGIVDNDEAPAQYWCEQCRPQLHTLFTDNYGVTRSWYNPDGEHKVKRRNNRRAPQKVVEIKEEKRAAEEKKINSNINNNSNNNTHKRERSRSTLNSRDAEYELNLKRALEESAKESGVQPEDIQLSASEIREIRSRTRSHDTRGENNDDEDMDDNNDEVEREDSKQEKSSKKRKAESEPEESHAEPEEELPVEPEDLKPKRKPEVKNSPKKNGKALSTAKKPKSETLEADKPFKPRMPQPKSSIAEMRKRVAGILEFIGRTQVEMANEQEQRTQLTKYVEERAYENLDIQKQLIDGYANTVNKMDDLTRKLLSWEQKFGKYGD